MRGQRTHYLDWLMVLIVYGIFVFHVALVFAAGTWLVSNGDRSIVLSAFAGFCFPWGIPAMFLIAGADAWFGLRSHRPSEFLWLRVQRLLVPMAIGLVTLTPLQRFVTSHNPPPSLDRLPAFYLSFFRSFHFELDPNWISTYWIHLWFLGYLFAVSAVCLPLLVWLRTAGGARLTAWLVKVSGHRGGLFLIGLPLLVSQVVLRPLFPDYQDWADIATYVAVFAWGAILFTTRGFEPAIRRDIRWFLAAGAVATAAVGLLLYSKPLGTSPVGQVGLGVVWSVNVWSWLLAVLYLGIRWLDFPHRVLTYTRESVLPFYVIHHPVVLTIASFVVTFDLGLWPKFAIILVGGFVTTLGLYEFGVRRWTVMRMLFGLKPLPVRSGPSGIVTVAPSDAA